MTARRDDVQLGTLRRVIGERPRAIDRAHGDYRRQPCRVCDPTDHPAAATGGIAGGKHDNRTETVPALRVGAGDRVRDAVIPRVIGVRIAPTVAHDRGTRLPGEVDRGADLAVRAALGPAQNTNRSQPRTWGHAGDALSV